MSKNYRIKDIALLAGVSTGTVDRILHNRGKVSEEARKRVEDVLKEIDYQPNLIARSLALKKSYHFVALIPAFQRGEYWERLSDGIKLAEKELFSYNIELQMIYFDQYDNASFDRIIPTIEEMDCQGVIIATLFEPSVRRLAERLDMALIPYVLIDSFIERTKCLAYYGTHSFDSGYIAGRLLYGQVENDDEIAIFHFKRPEGSNSPQVNRREEGFRRYLLDNGFNGAIHSLTMHADMREDNIDRLAKFFSDHDRVKAGIIFNSRAHILGDYIMEATPSRHFKLLGYDVIDANVRYLKSGLITHLISQRPEVQGYHCVKALFRHLVLKERVEPVNYMPIDILMKENIEYYNNYI